MDLRAIGSKLPSLSSNERAGRGFERAFGEALRSHGDKPARLRLPDERRDLVIDAPQRPLPPPPELRGGHPGERRLRHEERNRPEERHRSEDPLPPPPSDVVPVDAVAVEVRPDATPAPVPARADRELAGIRRASPRGHVDDVNRHDAPSVDMPEPAAERAEPAEPQSLRPAPVRERAPRAQHAVHAGHTHGHPVDLPPADAPPEAPADAPVPAENRPDPAAAAGDDEQDVEVRLDPDLAVHVHRSGHHVDVHLDGTPDALNALAGLGPELDAALSAGGFSLGEFSAGQHREERHQAPTPEPPAPRAAGNRREKRRDGFLIQRVA